MICYLSCHCSKVLCQHLDMNCSVVPKVDLPNCVQTISLQPYVVIIIYLLSFICNESDKIVIADNDGL